VYGFGFLFFLWGCLQKGAMASWFILVDHTQRHTTFGRVPLDEWSARRRDLNLAIQNTWEKETEIHACGGIRTRSLSKRADTGLKP